MNIQLLTSVILAVPRGHFVSLCWERPAKVRKGKEGLNIVKRVEGVVRIGIRYDNVNDVKECRADGTLPAVSNNGRPCWFHYPEGLFPYIAEHKTNGNRYLCCYFAKDGEGSKTGNLRSTWLMNGEIVQESDISDYLLASEKGGEAGKEDNVFFVPLDRLVRFSAEGVDLVPR